MCLLVTYWSSQQDERPAAEVRSQLQSISVRLTDVLDTLKEFNMSYFYIGAIPDNNFSASDSLMHTEEPETAVKLIGRSGQANRNRFVWMHLDTLQHAVFCASCTGAQRFICHAVIYCDLSELQQHERIKQSEELWHKTLPGELRSDSVKCSRELMETHPAKRTNVPTTLPLFPSVRLLPAGRSCCLTSRPSAASRPPACSPPDRDLWPPSGGRRLLKPVLHQ